MKSNHLPLLIVLFLFSCQKEKIQLVPSEFEPYVDEFFHQAQLRGHDLHKEDFNFSITLEEIEDPFIGGQCQFRGNKITIDIQNWEKGDEEWREFIIAHELGHCLLDRKHRNVKTTSNECYSFMRGGREDDFDCQQNLLSPNWKKYYYDELFEQETSLPFWYYNNRDYLQTNDQSNYLIQWKDTLVQEFRITDIDFQNLDTFLVEIDFDIINTDAISFRFYLGDIQFGGCPKCTASDVEVRKNNDKLYVSERFELNPEYKLSIAKRGKFATFFFNDRFLHTMESEILEENILYFYAYDDLKIKLSVNVITP